MLTRLVSSINNINNIRSDAITQLTALETKIFLAPISPTKKTILNAFVTYGLDVAKNRNAVSLITTSLDERMQNFKDIECFLLESDDSFIRLAKKYLTEKFYTGSLLRTHLEKAISAAEENLNYKRKAVYVGAGTGVLLTAYTSPFVGLPLLALTVIFHQHAKELCDEGLEFYEHSKVTFFPSKDDNDPHFFKTTYHRALGIADQLPDSFKPGL